MALFTDTALSTLDQLVAQDAAVLDVASSEGIDVTAKLGLAQEDVGAQLVGSSASSPFSPTTSAVWWPGVILTSNLQLGSVVVTPPLQMWHTFHSLELVYRDAYYSQLNDRYLGKWNAYRDLSKWAQELLRQTGIGIVADPVPMAQKPQLNAIAGTLNAQTYFVQISWLNTRNEEGMSSPVTSFAAPNNSFLEVTPPNPPANATGWNLYVGASIDSIGLQNGLSIAPNQPWIAPASGIVAGRAAGSGQAPNYFRQLPRYLQRG